MVFSSWWRRLVGGYSKYRMEVADLYRTAVPATGGLLSDLQKLQIFHNRMGEVHRVHQELGDLLIPGFTPDQMESWHSTLTALNAFATYLAAAPQMTSFMPTGPVSLTLSPDDPLFVRLAETLLRGGAEAPTQWLEGIGAASRRLSESFDAISALQAATNRCRKVLQSCQPKYRTTPDIPQLLNDIEVAKDYALQLASIEALYRRHSSSLPEEVNPLQANGWYAAIRGVESAEKLVKTFGTSSVLKETVCTPGALDQQALTTLSQTTEIALQHLNKMLSEKITFINLANSAQPEGVSRKWTVSELKACVIAAAFEFETVRAKLSKILAVLKPGQSVPLERLPKDADAIESLRHSLETIHSCNTILSRFGIEHPCELSETECRACDWLIQAPDDLLNSPLAQAIATTPQIRKQVAGVLADTKHAFEQLVSSSMVFSRVFDDSQNVSTGFVPKDLDLRQQARS